MVEFGYLRFDNSLLGMSFLMCFAPYLRFCFSFPLIRATSVPTATCVAVRVINIASIDSYVTPVGIDAGIRSGIDPLTLDALLACCSNCTAAS